MLWQLFPIGDGATVMFTDLLRIQSAEGLQKLLFDLHGEGSNMDHILRGREEETGNPCLSLVGKPDWCMITDKIGSE